MNEARKKLRNRTRKFDPRQVVFQAIKHMDYRDAPKITLYPPHILLLLIELTFRDWRDWPTTGRDVSEDDFNDLRNRIVDLEPKTRMPSDYGSIPLFIKTVSYQQFYLQARLTRNRLARPLLLYDALDPTAYITMRFNELFAMPVQRFQHLAAGFTLLMNSLPRHPPFAAASELHDVLECDPAEVAKLMTTISLRFNEVGPFLCKKPDRYRSYDYDFRKETTLTVRPVVQIGDHYYPYSVALLAYSLEHFVYDSLRENSPETFMAEFGTLFEKYVGCGLLQWGLKVLDEVQLRKMLPEGSKVVDYMVVGQGAVVLIDAKGVEMHHLARVSEKPEVVLHSLHNSIVKAIMQGNEVATHLRSSGTPELSKAADLPWYLLVVTYKPMYLGNGRGVSRVLGETSMQHLTEQLGHNPAIPLAHVYFLSVDEFDDLTAAVQSTLSIADILKAAVDNDANPETAKWAFQQHLWSLEIRSPTPKYLDQRFERFADDLRLPANPRPP